MFFSGLQGVSVLMACPNCSAETRESDRYCSKCGACLVETPIFKEEKGSRIASLSVLAMTLLGSLLLTLILSWIFHFPIFILAGFLPLLWRRRIQ
jgi:hypothetical protein